jgi:tetratricopeptide (TPR) repeat protein
MYLRIVLSCALLLGIAASTGCGSPQSREARYLQRGEQYLHDRNYDKAGVEFRNALQIDPRSIKARMALGHVAEKLDNPREAAGQYQAVVEQDPTNNEARGLLARLYLMGGLEDAAAKLIAPGLEKDPGDPLLLVVRGAARVQAGDLVGAKADAESALQRAPANDLAIALLASLYRRNGELDKATATVAAGLQRVPDNADLRIVLADLLVAQAKPDEARAQLEQLVTREPKELQHRYRLARFLVAQKNVDGAEQVLRAGIAAAPGNVAPKLALTEMLTATRGLSQASAVLAQFAGAEPKNMELQLALAGYQERNGNLQLAETSYHNILALAGTEPAGLVARNRLAVLRMKAGHAAEAAALVGEVLKENPGDNDALVIRANLALARNEPQAAIPDLRAVLRANPGMLVITRTLAQAHAANNELPLAEEALRAALKTAPRDVATLLDLAQLLKQQGQPREARSLIEQAATVAPADSAIQQTLYRIQAEQNDLDAARRTAQALIINLPRDPAGPYLLGLLDEAQGKPEAAIRDYEQSLAIESAGAESLAAVTRLYAKAGHYDRAYQRLDAILAAKPDNVVSLNLKGELLNAQGRLDAAAKQFSAAIDKSPKWWIPYRNLAAMHLRLKRPEQAVAVLRAGMDTTGELALATDLASVYEQTQQWDQAIDTYDAVLKRDPKSILALNNLAMLLVTQRDDSASLARASRLSAELEKSSDPAVMDTVAWVKYRNGDFANALSILQQAAAKVPNSPLLRFHLGMAQLKSGDHAGARSSIEAALKTGAHFEGVDEARSALESIRRTG